MSKPQTVRGILLFEKLNQKYQFIQNRGILVIHHIHVRNMFYIVSCDLVNCDMLIYVFMKVLA